MMVTKGVSTHRHFHLFHTCLQLGSHRNRLLKGKQEQASGSLDLKAGSNTGIAGKEMILL